MSEVFVDLDKYVEFSSVSWCGKKFSPETYMPKIEILKLRPVFRKQIEAFKVES
jgi:hypothetical protein